MNKVISILLSIVIILGSSYFKVCAKSPNYGVFTGASVSKVKKLAGYSEIVVDALYYEKSDIDYLHKNGIKVYSYLNIGSLETFRDYFENFSSITLGDYENWPDEKWIDVSNHKWQEYVIHTLAGSLVAKGVDGFFIDNVDVYSYLKNDNIFNGVLSIIAGIKSEYTKPIIINGGYDFFNKAIADGHKLNTIATAVNIECLYTNIDFAKNQFIINDTATVSSALEYATKLSDNGLNVYIIEYSSSSFTISKIQKLYKKYPYRVYISKSKSLN